MSLKTSVAAARPQTSSSATSSTAADPRPAVPAAASQRAESEKPIGHMGSGRMRSALLKVADKLKPEHGPKTYVTSALLDKAHQQAEQPAGKFFPAGYIPALKNYPKGKTGSAVANPFTGEVIAARDSTMTVTAQSTTKLYMAALLMILEGPKGENELFRTVGKQPSDEAFNADSRIADEAQSHKPLNPYINIGAMAVTNRTWELLNERDRQLAEHGKPVPEGGRRPEIVLRDLLRTLTGNDGIEVDHEVAESERETGDNNRRLLGNVARERQTPVDGKPRLDGKDQPYPEMNQERIDESAANYFRQCALKMSPQDHAKALWGLEHKINPETGKKYLTADQLAILKDLTDLAGNYDQSAELAKKTKGGAIAKSGVGGTQMGWIRSKIPGQPDIPFGIVSEGLNNFGNPKVGLSWLGFMGQQNLAFKESNPLKRARQKLGDLRPGALHEPAFKRSARAVDEALSENLKAQDEEKLKDLALSFMTEEGRQRVHARSERGFFLKEHKRGEDGNYEPVPNGKKLLSAPGYDGTMLTYTMVEGHNVGGHGDHPQTTGGAKILVSITPEAEPFVYDPASEKGKQLAA